MKVIGAAFGHHIDLCARGAAGICVRIGGRNAELLNRVQRNPQSALKGIALQLVVVVQTIHGHVGLVAAGACHRSATAVFRLIGLRIILVRVTSKIRDAGLKAQDRYRVAALRREVSELDGVERISLARVGGIHQRRLSADLDHFRCAPHLHRDVQRCRLAHLQRDLILLHGGKARDSDGQRVGRWWHLEKLIHAVVGRRGGS